MWGLLTSYVGVNYKLCGCYGFFHNSVGVLFRRLSGGNLANLLTKT